MLRWATGIWMRKIPERPAASDRPRQKLGMEFGIWIEPEMINPDSDLYRAHPDWVLALPGYAQATGRHQLVLNLNIPQAFDYGGAHELAAGRACG